MQTLSKSYELCKFSCVGSIRGIPSGRGWAHHARSGSQSEHRIHFILPACAASYIYYKVSYRARYLLTNHMLSTITGPDMLPFFHARVKLNHWATKFNAMVSWWSNEPSLAPYDRFISLRTEILGKHIIYSWSNVYISSFVFISSPHREGRKWIDK